jgi:hypothetical protein
VKKAITWISLITLLAGAALAETPDIWTASAKGNLDAIKKQLAAGTDVNATFVSPGVPGSGATPLHLAVVSGQLGAAKLLIEKGASIEAKAADEHQGTPLHWAAFVGRLDSVKFLLEKGAALNPKDKNGYTPLNSAMHPFEGNPDKSAVIAFLREKGGKSKDVPPREKSKEYASDVVKTSFRGSYFVNGEIHVNTYGTREGKALTTGHQDFKPSWSKTGDMLVFFRRLKHHPVTVNWITQICVINVDGTGFHTLSDGTHTDFNQTWTRDGLNTPIWNRKNPETDSFHVMQSKVGNKPGQEVSLTDKSYHTWAYTCLKDGRILVQSAHPDQGWGYFLMTRNTGGKPRFERIDCELAKTGLLDRVSVSPNETRVCFEYQTGFKYKDTGRTLYVADFDGKKRSITNAKAFANELGKPHWYAYPRWTKDETSIVFHANKTGKGALYLYRLKDGNTAKVSTDAKADYRYPHCEDTPK